MKACIQISTGKLIEAQSDAGDATLIANAIAAGYIANDLQVRIVSPAQLQALIPSPVVTPDPVDILQAALIAKNVISVQDIATAQASMANVQPILGATPA